MVLFTQSDRGISLAHGRTQRFAVFATLYAAQGVPVGFISVAIYAWLAEEGFSPGNVAMVAGIAGAPWALKLFWGPLVDRYQYVSMGHRRPWVLGAQAGLIAAALGAALLHGPRHSILVLAFALFAQGLFASLQDVAVDALAIDVLPEDELGRANGYMFVGKLVGYAMGGAGLSWVLARHGLRAASVAEALLLIPPFLIMLLAREKPSDRMFPWSSPSASEQRAAPRFHDTRVLLKRVFAALLVRSSVATAGGVLLAVTANTLALAAFKVHVVQQLGWRSTQLSLYLGAFGAVAALVGAGVCVLVIDRLGRVRLLVIVVASIAVLSGAFGLASPLWTERYLVVAFLLLNSLLLAAAVVGINALCMDLSVPAIAGTQYAVYMAIFNASTVLGNTLAGVVAQLLSMPALFMALPVINTLAILLVRRVDPEEVRRRFEHDALPAAPGGP